MKDTVKRYIEQELLSGRGAAALGDNEDLLGGGLVDSVGMMSLVLFIEDAFALRVPPEDVTIEHFFSVSTICSYVEERRAAP